MQRWRNLFVAATVTALSCSLMTGVATAATSGSTSPTIEVISAGDQSVPDAIVAQLATTSDPDYRADAAAVLQAWVTQADTQPLELTAADGTVTSWDAAELDAVLSTVESAPSAPAAPAGGASSDETPEASPSTPVAPSLRGAGRLAVDEDGPDTVDEPGSNPSPAPGEYGDLPEKVDPSVTAAGIDPNNPNTFPVSGNPGSGRSFWQNMIFTAERKVCDAGGCDVLDRYTSKVTINPGPTVTQVNSNNFYFPDSGYFNGAKFTMFAVCRGVVCKKTDTGYLPTSQIGKDYLRTYGDRHGNVLTVGIAFKTRTRSSGQLVFRAAAKTSDATCERASVGNICRY